ncbi:MAG: hypothetical protein LBS27_02715 [Bifidobacteriaceae bacterium]|nr:hypothetical protein [Bifidobacteriaceae bacterium]
MRPGIKTALGQGVRWAGRSAVLLLGLWALFVALQFVGALVPDSAIAAKVMRSMEAGLDPAATEVNALGWPNDRSTDCVALGTGIGQAETSLVDRALKVPRLGNCRSIETDIAQVAAGEQPEVSYYLRYWAGYASLFRPALAAWGMPGMAAVATCAFALGLLAMWSVLGRRLSVPLAAAFSLPLLIGTDALMLPGGSQVHALSMGVCFAGVAGVVLAAKRGIGRMALAAVVAGALINYFELINNAPLAWVVTAGVGGIWFLWTGAPAARVAKASAAAAVGWMLGYAGAFVERWLTAVAAAGPREALDQITQLVGIRAGLSHQSDYPTVEAQFGLATRLNIRDFFALPLGPLVFVLAVAAAAVLVVAATRRAGPGALARFAACAWTCALVPFWYEVMRNHSQMHSWFTFRAVAGGLGVILAAAVAVWCGVIGPSGFWRGGVGSRGVS